MKLLVVAVGDRMPGWVDAAFAEYAKRMPREARIELKQVRPESRATGKSVEQMLAAERDRIVAALPAGSLRVVLDEHGRQCTTAELARQLERWLAEGRDVAFVIGGPDGLDPGLKRDAQLTLALSAMTLPHGLARVVLAEQLYRATSILRGHPYHRE
ncbi:MAG: 23S rRNA (pseudouridine(1915)-N(3))-methyltransferase RlmH [Betaproteobacteria bacterium]|nr:23S rRNA (pseudouridine(1915)-N(3))-methyltransferase RlmH [Betaproteobacteria bacterium]